MNITTMKDFMDQKIYENISDEYFEIHERVENIRSAISTALADYSLKEINKSQIVDLADILQALTIELVRTMIDAGYDLDDGLTALTETYEVLNQQD